MSALRWPSALVLVALLRAGCADPSLETEADDLRTELTGLPGVTSAELDYTAPVTLDSGKVLLRVEMGADATPAEVAAVAAAAYDAFRGTHHDEEADLSLRVGRTTVALRSFEPEATVTAVETAVRTGVAAAPSTGSVAIDLTTQRVRQGDHVAGTYVVTLPQGSTWADVPELLASLEADQPDNPLIGWGGAAADGSTLGYDHGFPPEDLVHRWERVQEAGSPVAVRAVEGRALFAEGRLTERYDVRELDRTTHAQITALGDGPWTYDLTGPGGGRLASIDRYLCVRTSDGPYDDRLERWAEDRLGSCD